MFSSAMYSEQRSMCCVPKSPTSLRASISKQDDAATFWRAPWRSLTSHHEMKESREEPLSPVHPRRIAGGTRGNNPIVTSSLTSCQLGGALVLIAFALAVSVLLFRRKMQWRRSELERHARSSLRPAGASSESVCSNIAR